MVRVFVLLLALVLTPAAYALKVTASVDKNPVIVNESFILEVIADDDVDTNALDTSPLMKDFIVGRTSVSSQTSMVNFKTTRTTKWTTVLIARKEGQYTIPALNIDGEQTSPIALVVVSNAQAGPNQQQDLFITTDISAKELYVQQQITLTVKLHFATELKRGSLTEPTLDSANIKQIGADKEADTIINGRRYRVIERTYAISPQQSGEFTLKTPVFSGEILTQSNRRSSFFSFGDSKPVSVVGEDIKLEVKPIPLDYQGQWLPSELVSLHQEWQPEPDEFTVGEPITRTITLTVAGLSEEQLPKINMEMPPGLKVYPDQANLHTGMNNSRLVSQKVQNFAIVATRPGSYQIPEITIPWLNTVTNKYQQATIPAQQIKVTGEISDNTAAGTTTLPIQSTTNTAPTTIVVKESSSLQWVFLALWLLTSTAWLFTHLRNKPKKKTNTTKSNSGEYQQLVDACAKDLDTEVLRLLIPWANSLSNAFKVNNLADVKALFNDNELNEALNELERNCFSRSPQPWQGKQIAVIIKRLNKTDLNNSTQVTLSLNPQ